MVPEITVFPNRCAWCAPTPRAEEAVLPDRSRGGAGDCGPPWHDEQLMTPPAGMWSEWHCWQETPTLPPDRSSPWQLWQVEKFQSAARSRLLWNSSSCGLRMPPSCTPERKKESRPSTTQARIIAYAPLTGWWTASARAGSIVRRRRESGAPAVATGASVGPSASRYDVVRYPPAAVAPEWQDVQLVAASAAISSSQATGVAGEPPTSGRAFEHEHTTSAEAKSPRSARMRISGSPVGVHETDRREPVRPVADEALLTLL